MGIDDHVFPSGERPEIGHRLPLVQPAVECRRRIGQVRDAVHRRFLGGRRKGDKASRDTAPQRANHWFCLPWL